MKKLISQYAITDAREDGVNYGTNNGKYLFWERYTHLEEDGIDIFLLEELGGHYGDLAPYPEPIEISEKEYQRGYKFIPEGRGLVIK